MGYVESEPQFLHEGSDVQSISLILCTEEQVPKSGGSIVVTERHRVVFRKALAGALKNCLSKQLRIYIEGRLHTTCFTDEYQVKRYQTEIAAERFSLM